MSRTQNTKVPTINDLERIGSESYISSINSFVEQVGVFDDDVKEEEEFDLKSPKSPLVMSTIPQTQNWTAQHFHRHFKDKDAKRYRLDRNSGWTQSPWIASLELYKESYKDVRGFIPDFESFHVRCNSYEASYLSLKFGVILGKPYQTSKFHTTSFKLRLRQSKCIGKSLQHIFVH